MTWLHITYFCSIILTAAVMGYIAWYSRRNRDTVPGARFYMWVALLVSLLAVFDGMSMLSPSAERAAFWFNLRMLSFAFIPVLWLLFTIEYTGRQGLLTRLRIMPLFIVPAVTQIMIWTNSLHGLWVKHDVGFHQAGPFMIADTSVRVPGPWYSVHLLYTYLLMLAGVVIILVATARMLRESRGQAVALAAGTLIMIGGSLVPTFNLLPGSAINPLIPIFALGSLIIAWGLYRHRFLGVTPRIDREKPVPSALIAIFIALTVGILAMGYLYYRQYRNHYRAEVEMNLSAIVDLKTSEIVRWRRERLGDAEVLHGNPVFTALARRILADQADAGASWLLRTWLEKLQTASQYDHIILLDTHGTPHLSVSPEGKTACDEIQRHSAEILRKNAVTFLDFHRHEPEKQIHLGIMVPIIDNGRPLGILVLMIDPSLYLFPLLQRWPGSSRTAETLLVRRDGNDVLFINKLKFRTESALNLKVPLTEETVPAVMAVKGHEGIVEGIVEGIDYRGVPVIAALSRVPDSPWYMVARMDIEEVYAPVRERFWVMIVVILALITVAGAGIGVIWRKRGMRYIEEKVEAAETLRASEEKFSRAFMTSPYAITITDPKEGRFVDVNEAFSTITDYTREEAVSSSSVALNLWADVEERNHVVQELLGGRKVVGQEFKFKKKNGDIITGLFSAEFITLKTGLFILSSINDISDRIRMMGLLRSSEVRYRRLFEAAKDGILILDAETGMIVDVNPFLADMLGFSHEQFMGKTIWDIGFFRDLIANKINFLELQENDYIRYEDMPLETTDGRKIDVEFISNVYEIDHKRIIQCNIRDISERLRTQKALLEITSHQESLLSAIPDIVMEVDMNKVYTWANGPGIEFFGDDVIGREAAFYFEAKQDTYQLVQPIFDGDENVIYLESWQRRRDGEIRLLAWWCSVLKDESGKVIGALSSARDITELKRAEESLKASEDKFRGIFEYSTVGKSLTSPEGKLLQINRAFADMLGYTVEELQHVNFAKITHPDDIAESRECIRCLLANERESYRMEKRYFSKDGGIVWADVSTRLHRDMGGKPEYLITSIANITERKRSEEERLHFIKELERSNVELQQFAYVASHDLQEPLRMISSYLQLIEKRYKDRLDADANDFIKFAVDGASRLQSLIGGLLDYSRIKSHGKIFESVNTKEVLDKIRKDLEVQISESGAVIEYGELPVILADGTQISRLFQNLVQNAIKFGRADVPPLINITATKSNNEYVFCVRDNGIGIEEQYLERIFIIFQRLHGREEYPGTGIGLAICKRIVERHGGNIRVESIFGEGSSFYFSIPVMDVRTI